MNYVEYPSNLPIPSAGDWGEVTNIKTSYDLSFPTQGTTNRIPVKAIKLTWNLSPENYVLVREFIMSNLNFATYPFRIFLDVPGMRGYHVLRFKDLPSENLSGMTYSITGELWGEYEQLN